MSAPVVTDATVDALCGDLSAIRAPRGTSLNALSWQTEAPLRMLLNNLDPEVAEHPERLVVYGGTGRAARSHDALREIVRTLLRLRADETLLVQSGKPVAVFRTGEWAPRVLIANSLLVPRWATWDEFRRLEAEGLTMFGQMTAGSWIYIGTQGILQGTYQTFAAAGEQHFGSADLSGRTILTAGLGGMGGAQPLAATMAGAAILCVEVDASRIQRRLETRYLDEVADSLDDALSRMRGAAAEGRALSVGLLANAATVFPELVARGEHFDFVTDQTAAHDPLTGYVPAEVPFEEAAALRERDPEAYLRLARESIVAHVRAMTEFARAGCYVFDYGNNLRGEARDAGLADAFSYPGFVPAYIRPLFCRGIGPFRWAVLSGDPADIDVIDATLGPLFPDDSAAPALARARARARGVPGAAGADLLARVRGQGACGARDQRARALRCRFGPGRHRPRPSRRGLGGLAVPRDRGDAGRIRCDRGLADPQRPRQRRCGRDVGERAPRRRRGDRELDPRGDGRRRRRHRRCCRAARARADDGPGNGRGAARGRGLRRGARGGPRIRAGPPVRTGRSVVSDGEGGAARLLIRDLAQVASPAGDGAPLRGAALREVDVTHDGFVLCEDGRIAAVGRMRDLKPLDDVEEIDGQGLSAVPGLVDCHTHACFAGDRVEEFSLRAAGASYEELHARGGGILSTVRATRAAGEAGLAEALSEHVDWMLRAGTTTFEAKSGYGLDRETELAQLRVIRDAGGVPTWLGAHAVPPEFAETGADAYLDFLLGEVLPEAAQLAEAADVFLERGAFDADQARRYLAACRDAGLALRLHGDQFTESGAIPLAIELGARSVDHLEATGESGIAALAASDVTGVVLPASALFLNRPMPPARALVDAGAAVALATDFNPGSAFCESLPLVCSLAATQLGLAPEEALSACTVNAAHVLERADRKGRLAAGFDADVVLVAAEDWRHLAYHLGGPVIDTVIAGGKIAWSSRA